MSPEHLATIRRNQERAIKVVYLAKQNAGPDPERVARETLRLVDEMEARSRHAMAWRLVTYTLLSVLVVVLLYGLVG